MTAPRRVEILGLPLDLLTMQGTVDRMDDLIRRGGPHQHVVLNAAKVVQAHDDHALAEVIRSCDLVNADGISVVWAGRLLGEAVPERVSGIDLMDRVLERAEAEGWGVYFLGARPDVLGDVVEIVRRRHPRLVVSGARDGYWDPTEEDAVVEAVAATRPQVLLVAISSPRKEFFLAAHRDRLGVPMMIGVGGSFDVLAGRISRAPQWMQRLGLEWFHRLISEPRRMFRRYLVGNTRFILLVARELRRRRARRAVGA